MTNLFSNSSIYGFLFKLFLSTTLGVGIAGLYIKNSQQIYEAEIKIENTLSENVKNEELNYSKKMFDLILNDMQKVKILRDEKAIKNCQIDGEKSAAKNEGIEISNTSSSILIKIIQSTENSTSTLKCAESIMESVNNLISNLISELDREKLIKEDLKIKIIEERIKEDKDRLIYFYNNAEYYFKLTERIRMNEESLKTTISNAKYIKINNPIIFSLKVRNKTPTKSQVILIGMLWGLALGVVLGLSTLSFKHKNAFKSF